MAIKAETEDVLKTSDSEHSPLNSEYTWSMITSIEQVAGVANDWKALETNSAQPFSFFQSIDWCLNWWRAVGSNSEGSALQIFLLWQQGQLVSVWPMMLDEVVGGVNALVPLSFPHVEYSNIIVADTVENEILGQFVQEASNSIKCDLVSLPKIPKSSKLAMALGDGGHLAADVEIASIFELSTFDNFEQYQANLSKSTRRSRNKRKNKLSRIGDLTYQVCFADEVKYKAVVAKALDMKLHWLIETGRNDAKLSIDGIEDCLGSLDGNSVSQSGAVAGALILDGEIVAAELGFLQAGHYYSYLGAFDWSMREHSVGKVQIEEALNWAITSNVEKYDLLAEPAGYKDSWSNVEELLETRIFANTWRGYMFGIVWQNSVRPRVKKVFNSLPSDWRQKALGVKRKLTDKS